MAEVTDRVTAADEDRHASLHEVGAGGMSVAAAPGDLDAAGAFPQPATREGLDLGYTHQHDPEWETLRDSRPHQAPVQTQ